jgi:hypothetical protein
MVMHPITLVTPLRRLLLPIAVIAVATAVALAAIVALGPGSGPVLGAESADRHKGEIEIQPW